MVTFAKLGLSKNVIAALASQGITDALEVQEKIVPLVMQGKDVCFTAPTGSGKTLAYSLGFLRKLNKKMLIQLLILTPTRELCVQVGKELEKICDPLGINVGMLYGGRHVGGDYRTIGKKVHVLVGTPGRIIQHVNEKNIKVGDVKLIVFDESDQMFESGFYDDCSYVLSRVSTTAQVVLASATLTRQVKDFIDQKMGEHVFLTIGEQIPSTIKQEKIFCTMNDKKKLVHKLFNKTKFGQTMIFCNTKAKSEAVADSLCDANIRAKMINSNLDQKERENRLRLFRDKKIQVLVATDVASRGLHIEGVKSVINFDVPKREEFYVHRIGRTGRQGAKGYALTFVCDEDKERFEKIEKKFSLDIKER